MTCDLLLMSPVDETSDSDPVRNRRTYKCSTSNTFPCMTEIGFVVDN